MRLPSGASEIAENLDILTKHMDLGRIGTIQSHAGHCHLEKMMMLSYPCLHNRNIGYITILSKKMKVTGFINSQLDGLAGWTVHRQGLHTGKMRA